MKARLFPFALVTLVALPWAAAPFVTEAAGQGTSAGAQLVERMREASAAYSFSGTVGVMWRDGEKVRRTSVDVTAVDGTLEVEAGESRVVDKGRDTYVLGNRGWTSVLIAPISDTLPEPDHVWKLSTRNGPQVAGRPTMLVDAARGSYGVVQRLFIDTQTGLLLGRDVRDSRGNTLRSLEFTSIAIGGGPHALDQPGVPGRVADAVRTVPKGYRAPERPGGGYVLVSKAAVPDGGVQLSYSDGIFSISIYQQRGKLDWGGLASGGTTTDIAGHHARRYVEPGADVIVWERDGVVYTCVTDAPPEVITAMIEGLAPSGRNVIQKAVDFVLGPFDWE